MLRDGSSRCSGIVHCFRLVALLGVLALPLTAHGTSEKRASEDELKGLSTLRANESACGAVRCLVPPDQLEALTFQASSEWPPLSSEATPPKIEIPEMTHRTGVALRVQRRTPVVRISATRDIRCAHGAAVTKMDCP